MNIKQEKLAIDIALIPPQNIIDLAKQYNLSINSQNPDGIMLDETHLPHVTLVQLFIDTNKLTLLNQAIENTLKDFKPISLKINNIDSLMLSDGKEASYFLFENIAQIQAMHETLMEVSKPFAVNGDGKSFVSDPGEQILSSSVDWATNFREKASGPNFEAHITLGIGYKPNLEKEVEFIIDRLTVCHLGNFNTCRKILKEWRFIK
ncbi:MAG: 2'-5' RNA ligase family protein [bacterium]